MPSITWTLIFLIIFVVALVFAILAAVQGRMDVAVSRLTLALASLLCWKVFNGA